MQKAYRKIYINLIHLINSDEVDRIFLQARKHFNKTNVFSYKIKKCSSPINQNRVDDNN